MNERARSEQVTTREVDDGCDGGQCCPGDTAKAGYAEHGVRISPGQANLSYLGASNGPHVMNRLPELVIWGGTGNFKVLVELVRNRFRIVGFFDNNPEIPSEYCGIRCLGNWAQFEVWSSGLPSDAETHFLVSIGSGRGTDRLMLHEEIKGRGLNPLTVIHSSAFVAESASLGEGTQVYAQAAVCVDVRIGHCCIVNTGASVDHECVLEDGVSIGPGATLAGLVNVGRCADICAGATVLPRLRIGAGATVGAGAVVIEDVPERSVVVGNPARVIRGGIGCVQG